MIKPAWMLICMVIAILLIVFSRKTAWAIDVVELDRGEGFELVGTTVRASSVNVPNNVAFLSRSSGGNDVEFSATVTVTPADEASDWSFSGIVIGVDEANYCTLTLSYSKKNPNMRYVSLRVISDGEEIPKPQIPILSQKEESTLQVVVSFGIREHRAV